MKITLGLKPEWFSPEGSDASFELMPLDGLQKIEVTSHLAKRGDEIVMSPEGVKTAIDFALKNWRGIEDENGQAVPFTANSVRFLDEGTLAALAWRVYIGSSLTEGERKNS